MKKLLVLVSIAFVLAACMPVPEPVEVVTQERGEFITSRNGIPQGSFILIRYLPNGSGNQQIFADLFLNSELACSWDLNNTQPWERGEDLLYFTEENCEIDPRNTVIWHVDYPDGINYGQIVFESMMIQQIPVWTLTGTNYTMLD